MKQLANISQFESLQSVHTPHQAQIPVQNKSAEQRWLEWAYEHPELTAYAQRLSRAGRGWSDRSPTEIKTHDPFISRRKFYGRNPDYQGYRDALYNKEALNREYGGDKKQIQEYYKDLARQELSYYMEAAKQNGGFRGNVWPAMVERLHGNNLLSERELAYLGKNLNEIPSVISWIGMTIRNTGQFRGTKFGREAVQGRRWND